MKVSARPLHLVTTLLLCLSCSRDAAAHPRGPEAPYVVTLEDESGRELRAFHHDGQTFVLGHYGDRYAIRIQNRTGRRVEAVVSVDGRDVVSGRVGDFVRERGYLIDAYDSLVVEGFRQSTYEVAAFRFTSPAGSYSSQMGTPENVGVIGVAIFPERARPVALRTRPYHMAPQRRDYDDVYGRYRSGEGSSIEAKRKSGASPSAPASAPRASADRAGNLQAESSGRERSASGASSYAPSPAPRDNLGTAYGESVSSSVQEQPFERASPSSPTTVIALRYDDRQGLAARGIQIDPVYRAHRYPPCGPDAFPGNGYAPPPCRD
jgi:hypothetical protein